MRIYLRCKKIVGQASIFFNILLAPALVVMKLGCRVGTIRLLKGSSK
jgi:hypothetical protein